MGEWNAAAAARLRAAVRAFGRQEEVSERSGVPLTTLRRILGGQADPGTDRLAAITSVVGVSVEAIMAGVRTADADVVYVPIADIEVAAGAGRVPLDEPEGVGAWPFQRAWLATHLPGRTRLRIVKVAGDSQQPELRDGDAVMIDLDQTKLRDGMHVVRLDDTLLIKRVQVRGDQVLLKSANPEYDDIVVPYPRHGDDDRLAVVGRAVWAGKML